MFSFLCVHAPRKEWRNRLPIKVAIVTASNTKEAIEKFRPVHPLDPDTKHYNKPYAVAAMGCHFIE
jgi:hypothetical protein